MTGTRRIAWRVLMIVALPAILFAAWWFGSANSTNFLNPPLSRILEQYAKFWFSGDSWSDWPIITETVPGLTRLFLGYASALVVGIVLGVAIGSSRALRAYVEPVLELFRAIPPPILVPIFTLFLGIGDEMRIAVIAMGALWPILLNTVEGVRGLDPVLRDTAKAYRIGGVRRITQLVLPGASPQIVTGARQALSIAIILMVISEMFTAVDGLGFTIVSFQRSFAIPAMWSGVILLGLLGVLLSLLFKVITDRVLAWYHGYLQSQRGGN
ncbi:ABC transporter permease [Protaetiibacter intestinalis]|uniref:ABC transporter permease subunit n=1 Tax=Protaetiibacter intestinalis TaxID=2419774 RepID=A0A387B8Y1_9MICO|nr:ABC transporter permease subunit [Protaetiibacter intestinalis]AYF98218.1 ABC transporter permease subunit [Protaetiibacter intestinalis]